MAAVSFRQALVFGRVRVGLSQRGMAMHLGVLPNNLALWESGDEWFPVLYRARWGRIAGCPDPGSTLHHAACQKGCNAALDGRAWLDSLRSLAATRPDLNTHVMHYAESQCCTHRNSRLKRELAVDHHDCRAWRDGLKALDAGDHAAAARAFMAVFQTTPPLRVGTMSMLVRRALEAGQKAAGLEVWVREKAKSALEGGNLTADAQTYLDGIVNGDPQMREEEDHAG